MTLSVLLLLCAAYLVFSAPVGALAAYNTSIAVHRPFIWASLGDSWASGVINGSQGQPEYGGNQDDGLRNSAAYSVQLSRNNSWIPNGRPQEFHPLSCVGNRFSQVDRVAHPSHIQLDVPSGIDMIMLQAGYDSADLVSVAAACIYTPEGRDFGRAYPDPTGKCTQEINRASSYINGKDQNQLFQDTRLLVNSIFDNDKIKENPDFQLFMPGYAQVFYDQSSAGDWCSNASFATREQNRPVLSLALRREINQLLNGLNNGIKASIADSVHASRIHFVDVDAQFQGHRFCQPAHMLAEQFNGTSVYFWNMEPPNISLSSGRHTNNTSLSEASLSTAVDKDSSTALRTFHPTEIGYSVMTHAILQALNELYGTASATIDTASAKTSVQLYHSIQILFAEHNNYFSWYVFQGPFGKKVNPCIQSNEFTTAVDNNRDPRDHASLSLAYPPAIYPSANWPLQVDGWSDQGHCRIEGERDGSGALKCGDFLWYDIMSDASHNDDIIRCLRGPQGGVSFHRSWVVEW